MTPKLPSAKTLLEMEAGRKKVFENSHEENILKLREAGLTVEVTDLTSLAFHLELARGSGALPEEKVRKLCRKCMRVHDPKDPC
jgi:hypothetical protein